MTQTADAAGVALQEFVARAIDVAIEGASPDGPVVPFVLAQVDDTIQKHRIAVGDDIDGNDSIAVARDIATSIAGITRAAYAWDGYIRIDGARRDAIVVLAQDRDEDGAIVVCQPYVFQGGGGRQSPPATWCCSRRARNRSSTCRAPSVRTSTTGRRQRRPNPVPRAPCVSA